MSIYYRSNIHTTYEFQFLGYKRKHFIAGTQIQNLKNCLKRVVPPIPFYVDNQIFGNMQYISYSTHSTQYIHILTKRERRSFLICLPSTQFPLFMRSLLQAKHYGIRCSRFSHIVGRPYPAHPSLQARRNNFK